MFLLGSEPGSWGVLCMVPHLFSLAGGETLEVTERRSTRLHCGRGMDRRAGLLVALEILGYCGMLSKGSLGGT